MIPRRPLALPVHRVALVLLALLVFAIPTPGAAQGSSTISGIIVLNDGGMIPASAIVTVQLAEISAAGVSGAVVTERIFGTNGAQPPYAFTLPYDPGQINPARRYTVQGNIRLGSEVLYTTRTLYPVLTAGAYPQAGAATTNVQIVMSRPGSSGLPQASGGGLPLLIAAALLIAGLATMLLRRRLLRPQV